MNSTFLVLLCFIIPALVRILLRARASNEDAKPVNQERDELAEERFQKLCDQGEQLIAVSRGPGNQYYALTEKRLIIEEDYSTQTTILLKDIKKLQFTNASGSKVTNINECQYVSVFSDKKYVLSRCSERFDHIISFFMRWKDGEYGYSDIYGD